MGKKPKAEPGILIGQQMWVRLFLLRGTITCARAQILHFSFAFFVHSSAHFTPLERL
jgi:hypothetical protein